jgi:hypothetical protein
VSEQSSPNQDGSSGPPPKPPGPPPHGGYEPPPPPPGGYQPPPPPPGGGPYAPPPGGYDPARAPSSGTGQPPPESGDQLPPPYGQPPPGTGADPNQGFGAPPPPAPGAPLPPMAPPGRRGGPLKIILAVVAGLLLLCCIGIVAIATIGGSRFFGGDNLNNANVGTCVNADQSLNRSSDRFENVKLEVVSCADANADYKVVGRVENKTQAEANANTICDAFPDASFVYWQGRQNQRGTVLCLADAK